MVGILSLWLFACKFPKIVTEITIRKSSIVYLEKAVKAKMPGNTLCFTSKTCY